MKTHIFPSADNDVIYDPDSLKRQYPERQEAPEATPKRLDQKITEKTLAIIITNMHDKKIRLHDPKLHFGHMKATGLDVTIGQDLESRRWHSIPLNDIISIDHYIGETDPITGMERPLMAKIITRDGLIVNLISCKCCSLSGLRPDGKKVSYRLASVKGWRTIKTESR